MAYIQATTQVESNALRCYCVLLPHVLVSVATVDLSGHPSSIGGALLASCFCFSSSLSAHEVTPSTNPCLPATTAKYPPPASKSKQPPSCRVTPPSRGAVIFAYEWSVRWPSVRWVCLPYGIRAATGTLLVARPSTPTERACSADHDGLAFSLVLSSSSLMIGRPELLTGAGEKPKSCLRRRRTRRRRTRRRRRRRRNHYTSLA